jgi:cytochrome c oxidase subunit II
VHAKRLGGTVLGLGFSGCAGAQSALDPAGEGAEKIANLFWVMTAGSLVIWAAVVGLAVHALVRRPAPYPERYGHALIVGGGVILPTIVLAALLIYGLLMLPPLLAAAPPGSLKIAVTGEQYWWRVRYLNGGEPVELANEIRLPVGEPVQLELTSPDVIHSFWIPSLSGKVDMIPGRTTQLALKPTKLGTFNGVCAEYCGTSHAYMAFRVVVLPPDELESWLEAQRKPAVVRRDRVTTLGAELFDSNGCGACHTVRGTSARGVVGPDLSHVASRLTLAAGRLPNGAASLEDWLRRTEHLKPGVAMPHFGMLPDEQLHAIATYLESLR